MNRNSSSSALKPYIFRGACTSKALGRKDSFSKRMQEDSMYSRYRIAKPLFSVMFKAL